MRKVEVKHIQEFELDEVLKVLVDSFDMIL